MEHSLTSDPSDARGDPDKLNIQSPALKKLSLSPASVFNITEAKIDELGFRALVNRIETG